MPPQVTLPILQRTCCAVKSCPSYPMKCDRPYTLPPRRATKSCSAEQPFTKAEVGRIRAWGDHNQRPTQPLTQYMNQQQQLQCACQSTALWVYLRGSNASPLRHMVSEPWQAPCSPQTSPSSPSSTPPHCKNKKGYTRNAMRNAVPGWRHEHARS